MCFYDIPVGQNGTEMIKIFGLKLSLMIDYFIAVRKSNTKLFQTFFCQVNMHVYIWTENEVLIKTSYVMDPLEFSCRATHKTQRIS